MNLDNCSNFREISKNEYDDISLITIGIGKYKQKCDKFTQVLKYTHFDNRLKINEIPKELELLPDIHMIDFSNNNITKVDMNILQKLHKLSYINLGSNPINSFINVDDFTNKLSIKLTKPEIGNSLMRGPYIPYIRKHARLDYYIKMDKLINAIYNIEGLEKLYFKPNISIQGIHKFSSIMRIRNYIPATKIQKCWRKRNYLIGLNKPLYKVLVNIVLEYLL